jgi:hypothetical protein
MCKKYFQSYFAQLLVYSYLWDFLSSVNICLEDSHALGFRGVGHATFSLRECLTGLELAKRGIIGRPG